MEMISVSHALGKAQRKAANFLVIHKKRLLCLEDKPQLMSACTRVGQDNYEQERHVMGIWRPGAPLCDVCEILPNAVMR